MTDTRCGIVAIVGEPNAGKSTLVNRLVGGKVSIVTPKEQTTRFNVRGVCAHGVSQLIFIDTPGIFTATRDFEKSMVKTAWSGAGDADIVLFLLDAKRALREDAKNIAAQLKKSNKPVCLAINKVDSVKKPALLELAAACDALGLFTQIFMISAKNGDGVEDVKAWLAQNVPAGPWLYPADQMSDIPLRVLASEITREKLFLHLGQELPYATMVETENWDEKENLVRISQAIIVEREGQKKIVIGAGGAMLKTIGTASRKDLETEIGKRVFLELFVKVKPDWKTRYGRLLQSGPEHM